MQLGGYNSIRKNVFEIRPLTNIEQEQDARSRPLVAEVENRFKLFRILKLNYEEWTGYHRKLLCSGYRNENDQLILDRLMFNFLASAYGLTEHFEVSYRRRHKKNLEQIQEYKNFMKTLCGNSWAVAFFTDFRNYAQHFDLPIGNYVRNESRHSVSISITHDSSSLVKEYRDWKCSHLTPDRGEIDLIDLTEEYYYRLSHDFGKFVAKCFYPELEEIDSFYRTLTQEVKAKDQLARMVFITQNEKKSVGARTNLNLTLEIPPNYVYEELGINNDQDTDLVQQE